jgi:aspartate 1-decarboxylase
MLKCVVRGLIGAEADPYGIDAVTISAPIMLAAGLREHERVTLIAADTRTEAHILAGDEDVDLAVSGRLCAIAPIGTHVTLTAFAAVSDDELPNYCPRIVQLSGVAV